MFHGILLVLALSMDSLLAALAYALRGIRIPLTSALIIAVVSAGFLGLSFLSAFALSTLISPHAAAVLSAVMFAGLSLYSFFQSSLKRMLRHAARRLLTFHCGGAVFVLEIYLDEEKADRDQSKVLTAAEAFYLAVALSLDSLLSGMALGLDITQPLMIVAADFAAALFSIFAGSALAVRASGFRRFDTGMISGFLYALLAVSRFF